MNFVLHVGLPKSASTYLQRRFFNVHSEVLFLGKPLSPSHPAAFQELFFSALVDQPKFIYDGRRFKHLIKRYIEKSQTKIHKTAVLSHELLTNAFLGRVDLCERAKRIRALVPDDTKVIMVIRNQKELLYSYYNTWVREAGLTESFDKWSFWAIAEYDISGLVTLFYNEIYSLYCTLFGADKVLILPFELIRQAPQTAVSQICKYIGISNINVDPSPLHKSPSSKTLGALLSINKRTQSGPFAHTPYGRSRPWRLSHWYERHSYELPPTNCSENRALTNMLYGTDEDIVAYAKTLGLDCTPYVPMLSDTLGKYLNQILREKNIAFLDMARNLSNYNLLEKEIFKSSLTQRII